MRGGLRHTACNLLERGFVPAAYDLASFVAWGRWRAVAVSDTARSPWSLNGVLSTLILAEVSLTRWVRYPVGSSVLAVAKKVK